MPKHTPINTHLALIDAREALDAALKAWRQGDTYLNIHERVREIRRDLKRVQRHTKRNTEIFLMRGDDD